MTRKLTLPVQLSAGSNENEYLVTMLVGDGTYNGVFCPTEEVAMAAKSWEGQPLNLDHSWTVEDEVGFVKNPTMVGPALKAVLVLNPKTAKFAVAKAYIENRIAAGKAPEVSVGFYCNEEEDDVGRIVARNMRGDHLALVTRGACSPEAGCGVGLSQLTMNQKAEADKSAAPAPATGVERELTVKVTADTSEAEQALARVNAHANETARGITKVTEALAKLSTAPAAAPEAAAEAKPCGCADLKQQVADLTKERDALKTDSVALAAKLADAPKLFKLRAEAETLGVPLEESDGVPCLEKKLAMAKAVLAKHPERIVAQRFTAPARPTEDAATAAVRALSAIAGIPLSE